MSSKKIVCLGGGSLYFPRAIGDLVVRDELDDSEIVLYDLDIEKAERMAAMGRRLASEACANFTIRSTGHLADALDGADFAISSIGGSGAEVTRNVYDSYYHAADMYIPAKYGLFQVVGDTAGPAGMMMGLRSIPVYIDICREMEKRCPNAVLFSHSNPMAVLCRAMNKYSGIKVIGICHGVQATIRQAAEMMGVPARELQCTWIGTNHYYWILRAAHNGVDVTEMLNQRAAELGQKGSDNLAYRLSCIYGHKFGYPGAGHIVEFYSWATRVASQEEQPYTLPRTPRDTASTQPSRCPHRPSRHRK